MYAVKSLEATLGKFMATAAGMDGRDGLPVAKQLPPQYGKSFAGTMLACLMSWDPGWIERTDTR